MASKKKNSVIKSIVVVILVVVIAAGMGVGYLINYNIFGSDEAQVEETSESTAPKKSEYEIAIESDDLNNLKTMRDTLIENNGSDKDKKDIISGKDGVDTYVSQAYPSLSELERIRLEDRILNYINSRGVVIDPKESFFAIFDIEMNMANALVKSGHQGGFNDYDNLMYLAKGLKGLPGKEGPGLTDYSYVLANMCLSGQFDKSKVDELKKVSPELKKAIEAFQNNKNN